MDDGFLVQDGHTIVCLGDSITEAHDGYVSVMANLVAAVYPGRRIRIVNAGVGGRRSVDVRAALHQDVMPHDPDWVTLNIGVNDVWHGFMDFRRDRRLPGGDGAAGVPLGAYEAAVRGILATLRDHTRATVILVTPTLVGEDPVSPENVRLDAYADALVRLAGASGSLCCDARGAFTTALRLGRRADPTFCLTTDGVHLNGVGASLLATSLLASLGFFRTDRLVR